ncbi:MAG: DinB family protein [Acidobacteria bacterium]|nr:DinB family protein [Acidobacteriota bacterium]
MDDAFLDDFRQTIDRAAERLLGYSDSEASRHPAPGQWSRKEIIGHLIDSACNNHGRFVRAQLQDDLVFPGYDQDAWVRVERYQDRPWNELVVLFQSYNRHIVNVMATADAEELTRPRARHNLDELAWQTVSAAQPTTLEYFMRDYVEHLKHHLRQALPNEDERRAR